MVKIYLCLATYAFSKVRGPDITLLLLCINASLSLDTFSGESVYDINDSACNTYIQDIVASFTGKAQKEHIRFHSATLFSTTSFSLRSIPPMTTGIDRSHPSIVLFCGTAAVHHVGRSCYEPPVDGPASFHAIFCTIKNVILLILLGFMMDGDKSSFFVHPAMAV